MEFQVLVPWNLIDLWHPDIYWDIEKDCKNHQVKLPLLKKLVWNW